MVLREQLQHRLHQMFCLRTGNQDRGSDLEVQSVELLFAQNVLNGLVRSAPVDTLPEEKLLFFRELPVRVRQKLRVADTELAEQKKFGVASGIVEVRVFCESCGSSRKSLAEIHWLAVLKQEDVAVRVFDGQRFSILDRIDPFFVKVSRRFAKVGRLQGEARPGAERRGRHNFNLLPRTLRACADPWDRPRSV